MRFKIDRASLIVGRKFTVVICLTLYLRAIFQAQAPRGLTFGGTYTWRGLISEFYDITIHTWLQGLVGDRLRAVSFFSWSVERNAQNTYMTTRVTEGASRERHRRGMHSPY